MEMKSPSWNVLPPRVNFLFASSMAMSPQPETQQVPMPRATTAAWEVMPPRTVRMPWAAFMPVDVLGRGLETDENDLLAALLPLDGVVGGENDLAAGSARAGAEALAHRVRPWRALRRRTAGGAGCQGCCGSIIRTACFSSIMPSSTRSHAILSAACAVRLPLRVWSMKSLPFSTVNSMSCIS